MSLLRAGLLVAGMVLVAGCDGDRVYHVQGTVSIGGTPVPAGVIWFDPDIQKGNTNGPQGYAQIKDGRFQPLQTPETFSCAPGWKPAA